MIYQMDKAIAGMKADAGFDRVESFPAGEAIPFGVAVGKAADGSIKPGKADAIAGVALHTHTRRMNGYDKFDTVSVLTRGLAWVLATGTVTDGGAAEITAAGVFQDANAGDAYPNAVFLSGKETMSDETELVLVELHSPLA
jgi:hypothetical protein